MATVFVDRVVGLYALFLLACFGLAAMSLLGVEFPAAGAASLAMLSRVVCGAAIAGSVGLGAMLLPGFTTNPLAEALARLPVIGGTFARLMAALRTYRRRLGVLAASVLMSVAAHCLTALGIYLLARGLPGDHPSLAMHFLIVPIATVAAAVPLPGGLGAFEMALDFLYRAATSVDTASRQGFVVALAFLVIRLLVAAVGMVLYLAGRRQVRGLIDDAAGRDPCMPCAPTAAPAAGNVAAGHALRRQADAA
jgi:hypothetical protein